MVGITSYGAYVPWYRIGRQTIFEAMGWLGSATLLPGEKAVANYDEDSLTMAVAAGMDCLKGFERNKIDCLYLATTTSPHKERQGSIIIATALDLSHEIRTADFTDATKAGTTALLAACDSVKAGAVKSIMVCGSDCRMGKAGSSQEQTSGDGAAALLIGDSGVIASFEGSYSLSYDFMDHWRAEHDHTDRAWEDRWIRDVGYTRFISEAISGLLKKYSLNIKDFTKVVFPALYIKEHSAVGKAIGAEPGQIQEHLLDKVGYTGSASPLMGLVAALEDAKPGDKIIVASYGFGSDAAFFQVTPEIEKVRDRRGIKGHLASRQELTSYEKYLAFRNLIPVEKGIRGEEMAPTQISRLWRERKAILALCGSKCKVCGTPQYPPQRVCVNPSCGAIDEMDSYRFSGKMARLFTYTGDSLAYSPSPPSIYGIVNFEGGGRYWFDFTDCDLDSLEVDMLVEMSFRKKYLDEARGVHGYFWKAMPVRV